jgi:hypothetical protein
MKTKNLSSQFALIFFLSVSFIILINLANAEEVKIAQSTSTQSQIGPSSNVNGRKKISQVSLTENKILKKLKRDLSLGYYHQFLGPTMKGSALETYNVFQEGMDMPGTGRAPLQSFHALNLRYQINKDWAVGTSLAAVDGYTKTVENKGGIVNTPDGSFFNMRAYVSLPALKTTIGSLFSTVSYEAPTSVISRNDEMIGGLVINESFTFKSFSPNLSYGLMGQYYRSYFPHSRNTLPPPWPGANPTKLQTVIISGGPFINYRFNDFWQVSSLLTFDWDQKGGQTDTTKYNNNLPHRGRVGVNYFPQRIPYLTSVGVFSQGLLKFRPETTAMGAEFSLRY